MNIVAAVCQTLNFDKSLVERPLIFFLQLFNDVAMRREILSLKVKCKNSSEECVWTGELRDSEVSLFSY